MKFLTQRLGDDAFTSARGAIGDTAGNGLALNSANAGGTWGTLTAVTRQTAATVAPVITAAPAAEAPVNAGIMSAGSTLTAGDIAIVSMNADTNKIFAFVTLVELEAGTVIKFTDNGWLSSNAFRTGEGTMTWTSTGVVTAGTVVTINTTSTTSTASTGTVTDSGDANFSTGGDQIIAYQGADATPTLLFAINNEGNTTWQANAADSNTSALPTGLTNGTNAIALNEVDNAAYSGITSGTKAELLAAIVDPANWTRDDANNLTAPASFTVGGGTVPATVSIDDVTVTEGDAGTQILTFTVTRSNNTGAFSLGYATADDTALAGSDYVAASGTLSFTAGGALTQTVSVTVNGDADIESDESFTVGLSNIIDTIGTASFSDDTGTGTITNNDVPGAGDVAISDITVAEGDSASTIEVTVTRSGGTAAFTVDFATADGTAIESADYDAATGTLSFAENELSKVISITVNGDTTFEGTTPEQFFVNLSGATGTAVITDSQASVTITDSDIPESTLVINEIDSDTPGTDAAEFVELFDGGAGNTSLTGYVVVLYNGSNDLSYAAYDLDGYTTDENGYFVLGNTGVPSVDLVFNGNFLQNGADAVALYYGSASDFPNNSGFGPAQTLIDAIVYDTDDADDTGLLTGLGETVQYNESAGGTPADHALARTPNGEGGFVAQGPTPGTSNDPTPVLTVAVAASSISENGGISTATVTRTGSTASDLVVTLSSDDTGEATVPATVTILAGQTSASFDVTAVDDLDFDGSQTVTVSASAAGHIGEDDTVLVTDDDAANVSIDDVSIAEGNDGTSVLTFTVSRSDTTGAFTLDFATANGSATSGSDYVATSGTLTFATGGDLTQTISVTVNGDLSAEVNETFAVNLSNLVSTEGGAVIADASGTGTIENDDVSYIHEIQGTAFFSPILADAGISAYNVQSVTTVTVEAVVTGIDNAGALQGFFIMEEELDWDLDWHSSEGIFVMTRDDSNNGTAVDTAAAGLEIGEIVQVTAYVIEYQTFENLPRTFLTGATAIVQSNTITTVPTWVLDGSANHAIPNGTLSDDNPDFTDAVDGVGDTFDAENDALDFFETVEGMHVTIPDMVVADGFVEGSNAEVRFKAYSEAHANADQINDRGGYTINDGNVNYGGANNTDGDINPDIVELDFSGAGIGGTAGYHNQLNMGDALGEISGIIDFDFTEVKLYVTQGPSAEAVDQLDDTAPQQDVTTLTHDARSLRVSTFNVENLGGNADQARFDAIAEAIADNLLSPDIICIEEVQDNNGTTNDGTVDASTTWQRIVDAVNLATGKTYQWVDELPVNGAEGGAPGGNIRVGFLYDTARVQLGNLAADATIEERRAYTDRIGDGVRDSGDLIAFSDADVAITTADWTTTRKSLLAEFTFNGNTVYVTANHFPSKGGSDNFWELDQNNSNGNPTNSDWAQRNEVAEDVWSVLDYIADHDLDARLIEGGDFNDFYFYRPLQVATGSVDADGVTRDPSETRLVNLTVSELAPGERYTYAFDGRSQAIDHILSDEELAAVADYDVVHLNTGYSGRTGATNPAISDHDPTLARFDFRNFSEVLTGTTGADLLEGFGGADYLLGGTGNDTMIGGLGNDTFTVDSSGDVVIEASGQGSDAILSAITYSLYGQYIESLSLTGTADINATGNGFGNAITGNAGNNLIDGGSGADTMTGGAGNDTYVVGATSDVVIEAASEGTDTVRSSVTWTLGAHLEALILTGTAAIKGYGNALANALTGNDGVNTLYGGAGDDTFYVQTVGDAVSEATGEGNDLVVASVNFSLAGSQIENLTLTGSALNGTGNGLANTLTGNAGNNLLDGGTGVDSLIGGAGDDTYVVNTTGDVVTEIAAEGSDTVLSSATFTLSNEVEHLTLTGTGNTKATGNALGNILTGNSGNNTLTGLGGNDTYYVQNTADNVVEASGEGTDIIFSTVSYSLTGRYVETLTLTGMDNINATGNGQVNTLVGNDGNNTLNGGGGADILTGGLGSDLFLFGLNSRADTITDFTTDDTIDISAYTLGTETSALVTQVGGNTVINLGSGNIITVTGANQGDVLSHIVW
ncbi:hemolysin-type calcium-binding repeat 2 copies family protein [Asticcacaulis biprosthecium C19]|uniref:Hemolysin-type calcium-binding repeat 2 copies family protein n=1 Tax=Asticcacaulis biprosthecium C19 TaxID=715226 RepID=F4QMP2_9CAUL|nr:Calx-beta domain-containing protein [Asticcacaulis biprosthecium]EGF91483.1 hemolysin-type calcium-binding repeat 2 copies family protein [Asticcacaulis biprosthecium C19]